VEQDKATVLTFIGRPLYRIEEVAAADEEEEERDSAHEAEEGVDTADEHVKGVGVDGEGLTEE
jgi:hypothetical protein